MADEVDGKGSDSDNFWRQILNEVSAQASRRLSSNKRILVLGDDYCGKTSIISKLRSPGEDEIRKGAGLEYTYLDIHDEERDEHTHLSVWIVDGNDEYKQLLKHSFTKEVAKDVLVVLCVDISKPWNILESLDKWTRLLKEHLHSLQLSAKELNEMERNLVAKFKNMNTLEETSQDDADVQLDEDVLVNNFGIPIVVVVNKCDYMNVLESELEYREEHFDFIQKHLREFCLKCGAALVYTSAKENSNTSLLYKYLLQQLYDFKMNLTPQVIEKDAVFIPMGWDNLSKIKIVDEHIKTFNPNDSYKDHIFKPVSRKPINQEKEVLVDDEQTFLANQLELLNKAPATSSMQRTPQAGDHRISQRSPAMSPNQRIPQRAAAPSQKSKMDASKNAAQNSSETVLANFFNSLLNKNTTGKTSKTSSSASSRGDVQAELERMSKKSVKKDDQT